MQWLFVTSRFPWPLTHGTWLRVYHLADALVRQGQAVTVLSHPTDGATADAYDAIGAGVIPVAGGAAIDRGPGRCRLSPHPFDAALAEALADQAHHHDAVVLFRDKCLQYAPEARAANMVIADLVDDPVLAYPGGGAARYIFKLREGAYERRFAGDVDRFVFVAEPDAVAFGKRNARANVAYVPNGVDVDYFDPETVQAADETSPTVVFLGNMAFGPNDEAARWLIKQVAPCVWADKPDTQFVIVGPEPSKQLQALAGDRVRVTGYVDDVRGHLKAAAAVCLPMLSGAGIKNKLLEAWAMGAGVVASTRACQGVPAEDDENVLIADSPAAQAARIGELIDDVELRQRLGQAGRATVREQMTWAHAAQKYQRLCQQKVVQS